MLGFIDFYHKFEIFQLNLLKVRDYIIQGITK